MTRKDLPRVRGPCRGCGCSVPACWPAGPVVAFSLAGFRQCRLQHPVVSGLVASAVAALPLGRGPIAKRGLLPVGVREVEFWPTRFIAWRPSQGSDRPGILLGSRLL
jgi:hypothetical protein